MDDLSRLARDNHLMLSIIAELSFEGIRVISVTDGLDSDDEVSTLAIQVPGIFNELQLRDLENVEVPSDEVDGLRRSREKVFQAPPYRVDRGSA